MNKIFCMKEDKIPTFQGLKISKNVSMWGGVGCQAATIMKTRSVTGEMGMRLSALGTDWMTRLCVEPFPQSGSF